MNETKKTKRPKKPTGLPPAAHGTRPAGDQRTRRPESAAPANRRKPPATLPDEAAAAGVIRERVTSIRATVGATSLLAFGRAYLPGYFKLTPSPMHVELDGLLREATESRGVKLALAAPRGHAKSTLISLAYVLWSLCYEKEEYILLFSDTAEQAIALLGQVRQELSGNDRLREDFPKVCASSGPPGSWRRGEITTASGARITALGAEQKVRGRRHGASRPTLIIFDDIENEALAKSPDQREKRWEWLTGAALNAGTSTTNVVVAGTLIHPDSILSRLLGEAPPEPGSVGGPRPGWERRIYRAVTTPSVRGDLWDKWESIYRGDDVHEQESGRVAAQAFLDANEAAMTEGTGVLWPELEDYGRLMVARLEMGRRAFDAEKQNQPSSPERCVFREEDFHFWDGPGSDFATAEQLIKSFNGRCQMIGALDPSLGKAGLRADDSAIVSILRHLDTKQMYVIDADIRRRRPDEIIAAVLEYQRLRKYLRFGVEATQYQEFLKTEIERRLRDANYYVRVNAITQTTDKIGRVQRLQPLFASGMLKLSRRHGQLLDQLRRFPYGSHDDGPDALEMAVRTAEKPQARCVMLARGVW